MVITERERESLIDYTSARRCQEGGYCFYRLEEPNGADTLYALSIYACLGAPRRDVKTRQYLERLQRHDGSYESIFSAFYAIKGLQLMDKAPLVNSSCYLMNQIQRYHFFSNLAPSDVRTPLKKLLFLVESMVLSDMDIPDQIRGNIAVYIDSLKKPDGGFGMERATLVDTWHAVSILFHLHCRFDHDEVETFINACKEPESGFMGIPGSSLSSIEAIHAGIAASRTLSRKPVYLDRCLDFIRYCQRNNGGFAWSSGGGLQP